VLEVLEKRACLIAFFSIRSRSLLIQYPEE
jgi:hypothetical protein